jgi:uncharacterized membrane protein YcaP (DUF421 family)
MDFDFADIFLNDLSVALAIEIAMRTVVMFLMILAFLRLSGKKGIRQLSIFEVAIVIGLGSAAGDPMMNQEFAIVPSLVVFLGILAVYRGVTWLTSRSERFESLMEGDPAYIIEDGMFVMEEAGRKTYAKDEFFSEMRQQSIEHLGQVRIAILETTGSMSFYYFEDTEVRPGLPVLPKLYRQRRTVLQKAGDYACTKCGRVEHIDAGAQACPRCGQREWVEAISSVRRA